MIERPEFYSISSEIVLSSLDTTPQGLSEKEVRIRQKQFGLNTLRSHKINAFSIFIRQIFSNPLLLVLVAATLVSFFLGQHVSAYYIFAMIFVSIVLGFWNEFSAQKTVAGLLKRISSTVLVLRDGTKTEVPAHEITIGDIILVSQGSIIPADLRFIETKDLEINESALTGESLAVYKNNEPISIHNPSLSQMTNIGFMGTNVTAGMGKGVVIKLGKNTEYGKIAHISTFIKPETEFQKGLSSFGNLIIKVILILIAVMFVINFLLGHAFLESLLFSLAIAVGLTPELLPVIVTICLSHGAGKLAKKHVVAKQLISIENLGNMDVLCTDKTGTLTEGNIQVVDYINEHGKKDEKILQMGLLCNGAIVEHKITGNGIDVSLWDFAKKNNVTVTEGEKIDEEPFNFERRAMFSVIKTADTTTLIVKGAPETIFSLCKTTITKEHKDTYTFLSQDGYRVVALASKKVNAKKEYSWDDASDLTFDGFITFLDTPKKTAKGSLAKLNKLHVDVKVITGDNEIVTKKIAFEVGMNTDRVLLGSDIEALSDEELTHKLEDVSLFARVNPEQKSRIISLLKKAGHTVGYMGDGINDIPSLEAADVGISVNTAVDVAKEAASIVLLRKGLDVLADGIMEGRKTFSNTLKYILMATSSNFGNMFSAAGASFFLPFLPMKPVQIILTNGLYDISQMTVPSDNVDPESLIKPRHWNVDFIKKYMLFFGPISSLYDYLTFALLLLVFHMTNSAFQTGWFIESVLSQIVVVFVVRTSRTPFFKSKPGFWLTLTCALVCLFALIIPFSPLASSLGFTAIPPAAIFSILGLVFTYLLFVELIKNRFLKKYQL